jgi:RimK family alpha-L-glutamate ligase
MITSNKKPRLLILRSESTSAPHLRRLAQKLSSSLKRGGVDFDFARLEDVELFLENKGAKIFIKGKPLENWQAIYLRRVGTHTEMAFILANLSNKKRIGFIDSFHSQNNGMSKILQMFLFATNNIPVPKTYYVIAYSKKYLQRAASFLNFPIIIKTCNTSHGMGVFLAKNKKELEEKLIQLVKTASGEKIFLQEFIPNDFEFRILVVGNKIGAAEKKIRVRKNEFRNNVSLGAKEEFVKISSINKSILKTALRASKIANIQVSGVDIVEDANNRIVVFEANSCPEFTLDEKTSPELNALANYLKKCAKE